MKNSLIWPFHKLTGYTSSSYKPDDKQFLDKGGLGLFDLTLLKSDQQSQKLSYGFISIQLLQLDLNELENDGVQRLYEISIRLSNNLLLVYFFQLAIGIVCLLGSALYLDSGILKVFFMILPILIYSIVMVNFLLLKGAAITKLKEKGGFLKII